MPSQNIRPNQMRNSATQLKNDQDTFMKSILRFENKVPIKSDTTDSMPNIPISFQNKHPLLAWYKHDFNNGHMSYDEFPALLQYDNDANLITFLMEHGLISKQRPLHVMRW